MRNKTTRNSRKDSVLGFSSCTSLALGTKLSLNIAVLKRLLHFRQNDNLLPTREMCKMVFEELKALWSRAGIPMMEEKKCIDKLVKLWTNFYKLKKLPSNRNTKKLEEFNSEQKRLFDLTPKNVLQIMSVSRTDYWEEDYQFLQGQRQVPQEYSMGRVDRLTFVRENKKMARKSQMGKRTALTTVSRQEEDCNEDEKISMNLIYNHRETRLMKLLFALPQGQFQ